MAGRYPCAAMAFTCSRGTREIGTAVQGSVYSRSRRELLARPRSLNVRPSASIEAGDGVERRVRWPRPQGGEEFSGCSLPIRKLVAGVEPPGCDHRQDEEAALAEQRLIDVRVAFADGVGDVGQIELDRSATTRL